MQDAIGLLRRRFVLICLVWSSELILYEISLGYHMILQWPRASSFEHFCIRYTTDVRMMNIEYPLLTFAMNNFSRFFLRRFQRAVWLRACM